MPQVKLARRGKSNFRGITQQKSGRWSAQITFKGVHKGLGTFDTEEEAARAWDAASLELYGRCAS